MKAQVAIRWFVLGALVLGLGLPLLASGPSEAQRKQEELRKATLGAVESKPVPGPQVFQAVGFAISEPLGSLPLVTRAEAALAPGEEYPIREVENEEGPGGNRDDRFNGPSSGHEPDGALQTTAYPEAIPGTTVNFEGLAQSDNFAIFGSGVYPPDTNGAVGPNHFIQTVNLLARVYNKAGVPVTNPFKISSLFSALGAPCGTYDDGDPIVLYDRLADRWLISQFVVSVGGPYYQEIAISQTGDPTGSYFLYCFLVDNTKMNDYPKISVWPDGYYMTVNQFAPSYVGVGAFAFNRAKMLAGDPSANFIYFNLNATFPLVYSALPADLDGLTPPPVGAPNIVGYLSNTRNGDPANGINLYNFHVDWAVPANSTFAARAENRIPVAAFDSYSPAGRADIPQPVCVPPPTPCTSYKLDSIAGRFMYRLAYRNFGTYESLVTNTSVDVLVPTAYQSGVRWYQLKNASLGGAFSVADQGTFAPDANHRWMGSAAQDYWGNLALVYSVSSTTVFPSIRYAGRLASDPPGTMAQGEATLIAGTGVQRGTAYRWGDYSSIQVDPVDDTTFWFTTEYYTAAGQALSAAGWQTRVGSFRFPGSVAPAPGTITVHVTNCVTGAPVPNAQVVTVEGYFGATDATGTALLTVAAGSYTVSASKSTYQGPASGPATVGAGGSATVTLCLQPTVPIVTAAAATLTAEACVPANGAIDPNEQVTVNFCFSNVGSGATTNLVATLQTSGGVVRPSSPVTLGAIAGDVGQACGSFTFAADYTLTCGGPLTATFQLQDGAANLGTVSFNFTLGATQVVAGETFDGVTAPVLPVGWSATQVTAGSLALWATTTVRKDTLPNSVASGDPAFIADNRLDSAPMVLPNGPCKLRFKNWYNLENGYDGGVLEVSIAGGAFTDIITAGGSFVAGGYTTVVSGSYGNPVGGRQAWSGNSGTFIDTIITLPAAAQGQSVVFRFRMGSDNAVAGTGWWVDTLQITTPQCCVCPPITIAPAALPSTIVGLAYNQTLSASGTAGPYTYAVTAGTLPPGLSLSASGVLSGLPTSKLSFTFTVTATDAAGCTGTKIYTLAASTLFFLDDAGRDRLCVNSVTGAYTFQILTGPNAGMSFTGIANIVNGGAKIYSKPGAGDYLNFTYDSSRKRASGYFMSAAGVYATLADYNTANNTGGCS